MALKEGFMEIRGDINGIYEMQWFVLLTNGTMKYMNGPGDSKVDHLDFSIIKNTKRNSSNIFEVTTDQKVWTFRCQNETECTEWMDCIESIAAPFMNPNDQYPAGQQTEEMKSNITKNEYGGNNPFSTMCCELVSVHREHTVNGVDSNTNNQ